MKIVVDSDIPYISGILEQYAEVIYIKGAEISRSEVADADALIVRTRTRCDASLLEGSSVKLIATATIGFDHIDREWCCENGIKVVTSAGCNARGVLQWFGAVMVHLSRKHSFTPKQRTVGVVGMGNVGKLIAEYASMWGFKVLCCDPPRMEAEHLDQNDGFFDYNVIVNSCDIITYHTPLTYSGKYPTHHLFNSAIAKQIDNGTIILNSSRGEVVDSSALCTAIRNGAFAAIDTWENEPKLNEELLALTDIATPHIAGYSAQGKATATSMVVQAVATEFGLPLTQWYPKEIARSCARRVEWSDLVTEIEHYFNINAQSLKLKSDVEQFEQMRNVYVYRDEFF